MPDITLCTNQNCPLDKDCKRHQSHWKKVDVYQSYTEFIFTQKDGCDHFIPKNKS